MVTTTATALTSGPKKLELAPAPDTTTVVLAEPHEVIRTALSALLSGDPPIVVHGARDWDGLGLEIARHRPDVVIVNRRLVDGRAPELVAWLHAVAPGAAVVLTGMESDAAYGRWASAIGADAYAPLDSTPDALLETVHDAAAHRAA